MIKLQRINRKIEKIKIKIIKRMMRELIEASEFAKKYGGFASYDSLNGLDCKQDCEEREKETKGVDCGERMEIDYDDNIYSLDCDSKVILIYSLVLVCILVQL